MIYNIKRAQSKKRFQKLGHFQKKVPKTGTLKKVPKTGTFYVIVINNRYKELITMKK